MRRYASAPDGGKPLSDEANDGSSSRRRAASQTQREVMMKRAFLLVAALLIAVPAYGQAPSVWIDDLTWPEVQDAITAGKRTAIIYVGSSEQNGPHMVIGKHNFIARALAQRIAEELGDALVYP